MIYAINIFKASLTYLWQLRVTKVLLRPTGLGTRSPSFDLCAQEPQFWLKSRKCNQNHFNFEQIHISVFYWFNANFKCFLHPKYYIPNIVSQHGMCHNIGVSETFSLENSILYHGTSRYFKLFPWKAREKYKYHITCSIKKFQKILRVSHLK